MTTFQTDLLHWLPLLESHGDLLSQRVVTQAVLSGFDMPMLAFTLELDESDLIERWGQGVGFTDIASETREALAEFLDVPSWHIWFLSGELSVLDWTLGEETEAMLAERARARWVALQAEPDNAIAAFALLLAGDPLLDARFWSLMLADT